MNDVKWIPIHDYKEGKVNTVRGNIVDYKNPHISNVSPSDIATALGNICRFGGHVKQFYSVAQHSILVMMLVPPSLAREALMHDAAEAYIGDIIKPFKEMLGPWLKHTEEYFELRICQEFGLNYSVMKSPEIKDADRLALQIEHEALRNNNYQYFRDALPKRYEPNIVSPERHFNMTPEIATMCFVRAFAGIFELNLDQILPE